MPLQSAWILRRRKRGLASLHKLSQVVWKWLGEVQRTSAEFPVQARRWQHLGTSCSGAVLLCWPHLSPKQMT